MVVFSLKDLEAVIQSMPPFKGVKGSIVRLKIHDFMTYHKVELKAGANVNLILGPNGTGKSTIVCAICIGLAGKTKILGRASSLKEYIRRGCTSATTEIELFNPDGQNYVVKRYIKETGNGASSRWYLNGAKCQPAVIDKLLTSLNIQLDNLCQFLPQDRVQEFAKMDSCALLKSTMAAMAAGSQSLIRRHEELIELNEKVKQTEYSLKANMGTLRAEQQYNQRLENEVKNYHEREKFKEQISLLRGKKAWIIYLKSVKVFSKLKGELETIKAKKKAEEATLTPMKKSVQAMESKMIKYRQEMNNYRNQSVSLINSVKRKYEDDCDSVELKVNEINSELAAQERTEQERLKRVQICTEKITNLEEEFEQLRARGDLDEPRLQAEIAARETKVTKLSESMFKIASLNDTDDYEKRDLAAKMRCSEVELRRLDDLRNSRMKFLQRDNRDLYQAVEYFSRPENKAKLKGEIHEPMILHLCVNDLKYGQMVERHIGYSDMLAYFCEDKDDLEVILELCMKQNLRISVIHHKTPPGFKRPASHYPQEFLRKYRFVKVLVELIEAPDYYLSFICKKHRPELVPIGDSETEKLFKEITQNTTLSTFYTAECAYNIKKSYYGTEKCTSVNFLNPARIFTSEINAAERERLEDLVKNFKSEILRLEKQIQARAPEIKNLEDERRAAEDEMKNIHARINYRKQLEVKLNQAKRSKEMLDRDVPDLVTLRETSIREIWVQRAKKMNFLEWAVNEIEKNSRKGQQLIILKRQVSVLQSRIITKQNQLEDLEASINQNNGQIKTLSDEVEAKAAEAERNKREAIHQSKLTEAPQDVDQGAISLDDVDKELNLAEVQLRFLVDVDSSIVKDYEERLRNIDILTRKTGLDEGKLSDIKNDILVKKQEWLDPLQNLIARINDNFGRFFASMGCAGEVSLCAGDNENEFSKYGIKIMVKFRASEPLAEMCGSKGGSLQSGGERVITTALYVLALQELTVVPFRVIDEINQGMDAKNESRFFNLLCSMAKGDNTPQYFLLTPKMLPPVDYPDNVEFHFIMNGPKVNVPFEGSDNEDDVSEGEEEPEDSGSD